MVDEGVAVEDENGVKYYAPPVECRYCGRDADGVIVTSTEVGVFHCAVCDDCSEKFDSPNSQYRTF